MAELRSAFVDPAARDFRLKVGHSWSAAAIDGRPIGADLRALARNPSAALRAGPRRIAAPGIPPAISSA